MNGAQGNSKPKLQTGQVVTTVGVSKFMATSLEFCKFINESLQRYLKADWGDCDEEDRERCNAALTEGGMLMGVYNNKNSASLPETIWIITEWDRSVTTILLPEEY